MSMQIRISAQDLQQGNVTAYQVSRPPSYDLHVAIDPGTMDRQMRDNGFLSLGVCRPVSATGHRLSSRASASAAAGSGVSSGSRWRK